MAARVAGLLVAIIATLLCGAGAQAQSRSALKMNPKAYTGKRAWWLNYQYFPAWQTIGIQSDTLPYVRHRLQVYANGGYAGISFKKVSTLDFERKFGLGLGAAYSYFFNEYVGFKTGLGFSYAQSKGSVGEFSDRYQKIDEEHDEVIYDYSLTSVHEDYDIYMFDVPFEVVGRYKRFSLAGGVKVDMPVALKYTQNMTAVVNGAYFPQYDAYVDESRVLMCGQLGNLHSNGTFIFPPVVVLLTGEFMYDIPVTKKYSVGVGAYVDYSISHLVVRPKDMSHHKTHSTLVSTSDIIPVHIETNSILSSQKNMETESVTTDVRYFNAGIKVSLNVNWYSEPKPRILPY